MVFEFNEHQKELISKYQELIAYGYSKLSTISLDYTKVRARKTALYFMMGATQSYSESILKLMSSAPVYDKPGESMLRSQLEIWLNLRYIYSSRSEKYARLFLSDIIMGSITFAKKHKALWDKYPNWNLKFGTMQSAADWDNFISYNTKLLKRYRTRYNDKHVMRLPSLYDRTLIIDKYLDKLGTLSENTSAEKYYTLFYQYFSESSHSNMTGLKRYMRGIAENPEPFLDVDSKPEDAERVLVVSLVAYFNVLHFFLQVFGKYDPIEYKVFKAYVKKIS
jgi:hypothetical protein